jgi:hypothetical protein
VINEVCKRGHKIRAHASGKRYCAECQVAYQKKWFLEKSAEVKLEVLSHYGKDGRLECCWPECTINDPDMLSIDHVNNNGKADRKSNGSGVIFYRHLQSISYPEGYQTLCLNHQFKKELMRRREGLR